MSEQFFWKDLGKTHHRDGLLFSSAVFSSHKGSWFGAIVSSVFQD